MGQGRRHRTQRRVLDINKCPSGSKQRVGRVLSVTGVSGPVGLLSLAAAVIPASSDRSEGVRQIVVPVADVASELLS